MRALAEKQKEIEERGATLVALTPEHPEFTQGTVSDMEIPFPVLTDLNLEVADQYGLVFNLTHLTGLYENFAKLSEKNGEDASSRLPLTATYVIDPDGTITWAFLDANYRYRAEPSRILDALDHLTGKAGPEHLVLQFWENTWNPPYDFDLIDQLMTEDFVITSAGQRVEGRDNFKRWVTEFQERAISLRLEERDTFSKADGTRVVSRWHASARNGGMFDLEADGRPIEFTGISLWEVRDGKLAHNWVERSAWELYQRLTGD